MHDPYTGKGVVLNDYVSLSLQKGFFNYYYYFGNNIQLHKMLYQD